MSTPSIVDSTKKARVILLSGFLGSGKTTLLNHITATEKNMSGTVIIVNEFGRLGIDAALIKGPPGNDVVELTSGCICCTLALDLTKTLLDISRCFQPRLILIEASGVADPINICEVFKQSEIRKRMVLEKTITVLDADCWKMRHLFGTLFVLQLETADVILVNKIDLLNANDIPRVLSEIQSDNPHARVLPTIYCRSEPELNLIIEDETAQRSWVEANTAINDCAESNSFGANANDGTVSATRGIASAGYVAFDFHDTGVMDRGAFIKFLSALPMEMFRIKGCVRFQEQTLFLNYAGGKIDWSPCNGAPETRLALVGWNIKPDETILALTKCRVDNLRLPEASAE